MRKLGAAAGVFVVLAGCADPPRRVPHGRDDSNFGELVTPHAKTPEPLACRKMIQALLSRAAQCGLKTWDLPVDRFCEGKTGEEQQRLVTNSTVMVQLPCDELVARITQDPAADQWPGPVK